MAEEAGDLDYVDQYKQSKKYEAFDQSLNSRDPLKDTMEKYM